MLSFEHLLCIPSEVSSASPALQQAVYWADLLDATLDVGCIDDVSPAVLRKALDAAAAMVDEPICTGWVGSFEGASPGAAIQEYVSETGVDLVVARPSASQQADAPSLLEHLTCSLFVTAQATPLTSPQRLLVPTDFSGHAKAALEYAGEIASASDASIQLLHVIETTPYVALTPMDRLSMGPSSVPEHRAQRRLKALLDHEMPSGIPVETHLKYGTPADQILHFINHRNVDLT
jgi:Universal stress protein family.